MKDLTQESQITDQRKADHIRINLEEDVSFNTLTTGLERYYLMHEALPELNLDEIDVSTEIFGKVVRTPVFISSMTGGTARANEINQTLATAAEEVGMAMGLGSQRAAIEDEGLAQSFRIRKFAPTIPVFANVGAVQLNYGYGYEEMMVAVDMCRADALILHLNVLQEAVQPEGDRNFSGLLKKIEKLCRDMPIPVIAKEVGWGISEQTARRLIGAGISAIDVAGAGGTSWSQVEMYRAQTARNRRIAGAFIDWGIPTAESIVQCRRVTDTLPILASGGIHSGIEIAKCIALGADLAGIAGDFLKAAVGDGIDGVVDLAKTVTDELRIAMFCSGAGDIHTLSKTPIHIREA
ncbi:MAG: type 2 isopentenyl-diphosphate Delta-isomerase [Chloroflexota bacterium]